MNSDLYQDRNMDKVNDNNTKFLGWLQSFTKKVVSIFSVLYILVIIVMVAMIAYQIRNGMADSLPTMITELNETFRVVIGGYLIKAGVENGFKITGTLLSNLNMQKLNAQGPVVSEDDSSVSDDYDNNYEGQEIEYDR